VEKEKSTVKLIGMLDSPYVRRVAVSLQWLGLRFEHAPLSVFRNFADIQALNPAVKVPTLVCGDGTVLTDSTLILQYAETLAAPRNLMPAEPAALRQALHVIGLALAACEKSVQLVYEQRLRPAERQHEPWVQRVSSQLLGAYGALEQALARSPLAAEDEAALTQATVSTAVAWHFTQRMLPGVVPSETHPRLAALSAQAEALPVFRAAPYGDGTVQPRA
jgi:glutathione S-transferase